MKPSTQIAATLREEIEKGTYAAGAKLPGVAELAERFGAARQTIQVAVDQLRAEGLVLSVSGRGWFVSDRKPVVRLARNRLAREEREAGRGAFMTDAASAGFKPAVTVKISRAQPPAEIAALLGIKADAAVVIRDRVMHADGETVQLSASYLPLDVAGDTQLEQVDTGSGGAYARLEELGHHLVDFTETVAARAPRPEEAETLNLAPGTPVLQVTRLARTEDRAVEVNVMVMNSQRYELVYRIDG